MPKMPKMPVSGYADGSVGPVAQLAQLVEHRTVTREVASSTPAGPTLSVSK